MIEAAVDMYLLCQFGMLGFLIIQKIFPCIKWNSLTYRIKLLVLF
jgi:hypothetical protein